MSATECLFPAESEFLHTGYSPIDEELPMTLQVRLIGKGGFVLASDMKNVGLGYRVMTHSSMIEKIYFSRNWRAAWCSSGHSICDTICQKLKDGLHEATGGSGSSLDVLQKHLLAVVDECRRILKQGEWPSGRILLVVLEGHGARGCWVDIGRSGNTDFCGVQGGKPFTDKMYSGDLGNSAVFFTEKYYRPGAAMVCSNWESAIKDAKRRINELKFSIRVFEEKKKRGGPWPGSLSATPQRRSSNTELAHCQNFKKT